jgi:hypothetical protein
MTRINLVRSAASQINHSAQDSVAWGKLNLGTTASPLVFAAILIVCSLAVGCTSEKPKTETSNQPIAQPISPPATTPVSSPAPVAQAEPKPVHRKVVRRVPATVTYVDKTTGLSFQYPHKFALKTGDSADKLVSSDPVPMNFAQPGGVALAAVMVPEGAYPKSDLAAAFFDVSMNKSLTAEQCGEFSISKPTPVVAADASVRPATQAADSPKPSSPPSEPASNLSPKLSPKLMIGDMELQSTETLTSQGTGAEASKYYHVFENGSCYEFALKVATTGGETDEGSKPVDRDEVFGRLEKILATVKITPVAAPEVATSDITSQASPATPAQ